VRATSLSIALVCGACGDRTPLLNPHPDSGEDASIQPAPEGGLEEEVVPEADATCAAKCNDGIPCTRDDCDPSGGCTHTPDDSVCPDTQLCSPKRGCDAFVYGAASDGHLYEVRIPSAVLVDIGLSPATAANLALASDGTLYLTDTYVLYRADRGTAATNAVGPMLPLHQYGGLGSSTGGGLQATADVPDLFRVDSMNGAAAILAVFPPGYRASGDVTSIGSTFYVSAIDNAQPATDYIVAFDASTTSSMVVGNIGFHCVWGLATLGGVLYGLTCEARLLQIDPNSGKATDLGGTGVPFLGAAGR
jgi:hypothetical protein